MARQATPRRKRRGARTSPVELAINGFQTGEFKHHRILAAWRKAIQVTKVKATRVAVSERTIESGAPADESVDRDHDASYRLYMFVTCAGGFKELQQLVLITISLLNDELHPDAPIEFWLDGERSWMQLSFRR